MVDPRQKKLLTEIMEADSKDGLYDNDKLTAVEWLAQKITNHHDKDFNTFYRAEIEQAKQMEKNQRQKDWDEGFESGAKSPEDVPLKISNTITLSNK